VVKNKFQILAIFKILALCFFVLFTSSCRLPDNFGFYQPITMRLSAPDGPPEYKAGWYSGCKSGTASRSTSGFANAGSYQEGKGPEFASGVYQHDPAYQTGWGQGWFACTIHVSVFTASHSMANGPLQ
jgi:hypothetical protein